MRNKSLLSLTACVVHLTNIIGWVVLVLVINACTGTKPREMFNESKAPLLPDYSNLANWAAHPDKQDPADQTPCPKLQNEQAAAAVDVFFLHPTTYTGSSRHEKNWNADVKDEKTNQKTDQSTILFQASIFNSAGRVFAPRYRQAHLNSFYTKDKKSAQQALDLAYADVKAAFMYYLEHWNGGRPFIIAAHSQGAFHAMQLLRSEIENTPLQRRLVVAYSVGYPLPKDYFKQLKPCESPEETGCFCTWRTFNRSFGLKKAHDTTVVCTNPLTWTTQEGGRAPVSANKGGVVRPFCAVYPQIADAEVYKGVLLCQKPRFPGSFLVRSKNYHVGDLNLYYMNVRENANARARAFLSKKQP